MLIHSDKSILNGEEEQNFDDKIYVLFVMTR